MRFAVARQDGLTEERAALVDDGYGGSDALAPAEKAALAYTDVLLAGSAPDDALAADLRRHFTEGQLVELALGVSLFHGFSKMLVVLGLEPESMSTTVMPTPDVPTGR